MADEEVGPALALNGVVQPVEVEATVLVRVP